MNDQYSGYPQFRPYPPQQQKTNGRSIAALVLGILSIVLPYIGILLGIVAIILASISLKEINRTGEQGRGMAVAGLVCGIVGTVIYAIFILIAIVAFTTFTTITDTTTTYTTSLS